jgi:hypothetical protein
MGTINYDGDAMVTGEYYVSGWWFGTWLLIFQILGRIVPTDSYFSEGLKPPTRYTCICIDMTNNSGDYIGYTSHR